MNLIPWTREPMNGGLARLRNEMDRMFEQFGMEPFGALEPKERAGWLPAMDVSENDTSVTVKAEVPGIPAKDMDISISGTTLTISGEKEEKEEKKEENYYRSERRFGSFRRVVELPETIDADKVTAEVDNGVVTVTIAKKPGAKTKQIEVKAAPAKKVPVGT